jgi:hypothetical protein
VAANINVEHVLLTIAYNIHVLKRDTWCVFVPQIEGVLEFVVTPRNMFWSIASNTKVRIKMLLGRIAEHANIMGEVGSGPDGHANKFVISA